MNNFRLSLSSALLLIATFVYCSVAVILSATVYAEMVAHYIKQALVIPVFCALGLPIAALCFRPKAPLAFIRDILVNRAVRLTFITFVFCAGIAAFTTLKIYIPKVMPFWADPLLADIDSWLHGGDPGLALHAILPNYLEYPIAFLYGFVWFGLWFGIVGAMALHDGEKRRRRYFWSMALTICLLGTVTATLLSSVGPVFYPHFVDPDRFAALLGTIRASAFGDYMEIASQYLLESYDLGAPGIGAGISAMPSIHLAIVTLNACMLFGINKYLGWAAWAYVFIIQLGSVYLGWHYAIDGYVSIAAVSLIWFVSGLPVWSAVPSWVAGKLPTIRDAVDPRPRLPL